MHSFIGKNAMVLTYTHPEYYPPLLNAIDELSSCFENLQVISRNLKKTEWEFPENVQIISSGKYIPIRESEQASVIWKVKSFYEFRGDVYNHIKNKKPEWVMCNDPISLYALKGIIHKLKYPVKIWYHSHDVAELNTMRKYSVGYFAVKSEQEFFGQIDLFTLPSEDRLPYYPIDKKKTNWLVVPNYPSKRRMENQEKTAWQKSSEFNMIYQGRVSDEHGLEETIDFVKSDGSLKLTIIGPGDMKYIDGLKQRISDSPVSKNIQIMEPVPYKKLRTITMRHQLGLAINKPLNILYSTAATASNKIYEYAAAGLPVLYYSDPHYIKHLGKYSWAIPTDLTIGGFREAVHRIQENYSELSAAALADFSNELNFTCAFAPVIATLKHLSPGILR